MDRRDFLSLASHGAGALALGGCESERTEVARRAAPSELTPPAVPPTVPPALPVGAPEPEPAASTLEELAQRLEGRLLLPTDADHQRRRLLNNSAFDRVVPRAIAEVRSPDDVSRCIRFARRARVPFAVMSGGHSYLGASTGT
ncbi:MAG TPA: FAD-binding protein, partial [Polyangiaceae bacterium]|nr:FAD-binding protein [Polyangiaceae bacterium]